MNIIEIGSTSIKKVDEGMSRCIIICIALFILGCGRDSSQAPVAQSESISDASKRTILQLDSMNIAALEIALKDSVTTESFAVIRFLHDTLPKRLFHLTALRDLTIAFTYLEEVPREICNFKSLVVLSLNSNKLTDIKHITCLNALREIELRNNKLTKLPPNFHHLDKLEYVNLANNDFSNGLNSQLPPGIREIDLSGCGLIRFPIELLSIEPIEVINISDNPQLRTLPSNIKDLTHLNILNLKGTGISVDEVEDIRNQMNRCTIYY